MTRLIQWSVVAFTAIAALTPSANASETDLSCRGCNVLFLNLDFVRADYVGLIGDSIATRNTDEYFRNSIIFENAYSPAGSTYRGDLSVFTATSPHYFNMDVVTFSTVKTGEPDPWYEIFTNPVTIAEVLRKRGYDTWSLNKGHRSGSSTFLDRGFGHYRQFGLRVLIEDSLPALVEASRAARQPFFIHYHAIPTRLHRAFYPVNRPRIEHPHIRYFEYRRQGQPYGYKVISDLGAGWANQRLAEHRIYRQQLVYADEQLASLYDELESLESDTIIVFFSNHGTQLGDKGIFASNGVSFESSVRVPLLIKHPKVERPIRIKTPVSMMDFVPTIMDMLDIGDLPVSWDGMSLLPLIQTGYYERAYLTGKNDPDEYVRQGDWKLIVKTKIRRNLFEKGASGLARVDLYNDKEILANRIFYDHRFGFFSDGIVRQGEWELHVRDEKQYLLYNLAVDPDEGTNLASRYPAIVKKLKGILQKEHQRAESRLNDLTEQ